MAAFAQDVKADVYVLSHATAPFIKKETIEACIEAICSGKYDSALSVKKQQDFLWQNNSPFNYDLTNIPRTQDLPALYMETSGVYAFKSDIINKYHRRVGNVPFLAEVGEIESIDIDEMEDFMIADAINEYINKRVEVGALSKCYILRTIHIVANEHRVPNYRIGRAA